ncbi:MAG TPA: ABC transporter substrate-binding protein [Chthonomonadales bacterium]|nr:ABC transporter substrate-binding protein [Chthonomonadales bacterium]
MRRCILAMTGLMLLVAVACATLNGCRRGSADPKPKIRLSFWSMWSGAEEKNFERVLARYEELNPHIEIENLGSIRDDTKTIRAIVAGVPPDIFTLADPLYLGPLAANGAIYCMDEWFRKAGFREEDFVPASLSLCRFKGRLYAMPYLIDDYALLWNKKAFREAGLDPERPPQTLEELREYAIKLTKTRDGDIVQLGFGPLDEIYILYKLFGGRLYDPQTNCITPDDPNNIAAMEWYRDLVEKMGGYRKVNAFQAGFGAAQGANNPFFVGKIAMMINGEWIPYWLHKYAPHVEYGVVPLPPPKDHPERARTTWLGGNMICIPRGSKHPEEAWKLLVWMQTDEAQKLFASLMNNVPNQRSALRLPELRRGAPYKEKFGVYLDLADSPNGGHFPALPVANLYNSELNTALSLVLDGQKTPQQALRDVRIRVQRELDRYR